MSAQENAAVVRRFYEEAINQQNMDLVSAICPDCFVHRTAPASQGSGFEEWMQVVQAVFHAFPDLHYAVHDVVAAGDQVAVRWTATGTHRGEFEGVPATGKQVTMAGMSLCRMEDSQIHEMWNVWDSLGLMQQIGVALSPGQAIA